MTRDNWKNILKASNICIYIYVNSVSTSISTDTTIWQLGTTSCKKLLDKFGFDAMHAPGTRLFADLYRANLQESS